MSHKVFLLCGVISPLLFVGLTVLGGALRPGYSHVSDTVSELFSPGAPNKRLLDVLHTSCAVLGVLFGIGVWQFVRGCEYDGLVGPVAAGMIVAIGLVNVATATLFPQDAWGAPPTFPGQLHKALAGVLALLSILSTLLMGVYLRRTGVLPGFGMYSFVTVGVIVLSGGFAVATLGTPIMGLTERITILASVQWTFVFALKLLLR